MAKVNFDDAIFSREQKSGIGVVIRHAQEEVLASLSKILTQVHTPFEVETIATASALQFALQNTRALGSVFLSRVCKNVATDRLKPRFLQNVA